MAPCRIASIWRHGTNSRNEVSTISTASVREYWLESPVHLYRVPEGLEAYGMLTEPFSVSEKALNEAIQIQIARIGEDGFRHRTPRVLVTGLGPIGFTAALISLAHGF